MATTRTTTTAEDHLAEALYDLARCREALEFVRARLVAVPADDADGGTVAYRGYFTRGEVEHMRAVAGEDGP